MDSILNTAKKACMQPEEYTFFDDIIMMYTNMVLGTLTQLGVGPEKGFVIESKEDEWSDFLKGEKAKRLEMVKTYVGIRVHLLFDPPSNATLLSALERQSAELEWRIQHTVET